MAGLVPAIHVFSLNPKTKDVGARHKAGHGGRESSRLFRSAELFAHVHDPAISRQRLDTFDRIAMPLIPGDVADQRLSGIEADDATTKGACAFFACGKQHAAHATFLRSWCGGNAPD